MKKVIKCLILLSVLYSAISLKCGENEIEGCNRCGTGENSTKCSLCEDKYFLVLDGEKCIRCDDKLLAMAGCAGNCQMIKSEKNVLCQENSCKDGYYEIYPGTCAVCSFLFFGCSKCSYTNDIFNCLECESNYYYVSTLDNQCKYCGLSGCKKCLNENFCGECKEGYALFPNGECKYYDYNCKKIKYSEEKGVGICLECNDGYALYPNGTCIYTPNCKISSFSERENRPICLECNKGYALYPNGTCKDYEYYCKNNIYSEQEKKGICLKCNEGYYLDSTNKCNYCNQYQSKYHKDFYGCKECHSENSELICDQAEKGYYITSSGTNIYSCSNSIQNCKECSYHTEEDLNNNILKCDECSNDLYLSSDERYCKYCSSKENGCIICSDNDEQTICDKCSYGYGLLSDGSCFKCSDNFGEGCTSCSMSPFDFKLYCTGCSEGYTLGNDGKCKHCVNDANLIGCKSCEALGINGFKCLSCLNDYCLIDGRCQLVIDNEFSTCKEMVNIGNNEEIIYSCIECKYQAYIFAIKDNNARICVQPSSSNDLEHCQLSRKEAIGENNFTCLQCESRVLLEYDNDKKKQLCKSCKEGYYKYESSSSFYCERCDYVNGCQKCHANENNYVICDECLLGYIKKGNRCQSYYYYYCEEYALDENQEVLCSKLKEPYFLNKKSEIDVCVNYIDYCTKCSYLDNELKCEKCMEEYFINKDGKCQHCYINKNIGLHCISCTDNEELKKNAPCQKCNGDYFLTKENTCIFCKSENYGGLLCQECGYIKVNNEETIGCIKCSNGYAIDGKCYELYVSYCQEYGAYLNKNNEKEFGCIKCWEDYYLDDNNECKTTQIDDSVYQEIYSSYIEIYPDSDDKIIEGCLYYGYKYNSYYCIGCDPNYILNKGYCLKKIDNPFLTNCYSYDYSSSYLKCKECNYDYNYIKNNYINTFLFCENKYYGKCREYENIGTELNPIYSCKSCSYTTILHENGMKVCDDSGIFNNRCKEGNINTNYYTNIYTCTKCDSIYILSYSNYYEKFICKYIYEDEKTNNISISIYDSDTGTQSINGQCDHGYFTRNGNVCIKCDDSLNGMPGCGGKCSFKIDRENQLQCEVDNCKEGYFETLPGKCELCLKGIYGCKSCAYIINDKKAIFKPERKRKLICNECNDGLFLLDGICETCYNIIDGCSTCHKENNLFKCDQTYDGYYIDKEGNVKRCENNCLKCSLINEAGTNKVKCYSVAIGYYLDEEGKINKCEDICKNCYMINENGINKVKCEEAIYGYFINREGIIKECSDENEGIANCNYCSFDSKLICKYCSSGYDLVDNQCKAFEIIGCSVFGLNYDDNTHYCFACKNDYLYINNLKSCVKKTEETLYCQQADLIEIGKNTFYNCTSCLDNYKKVKNSDGYIKCNNSLLFSSIFDYCNLFANIGTSNEPFYICEECLYSWYSFPYYAILVDEYENQICVYNDFTPNCKKGKMNVYYKKENYNDAYYLNYNYNCSECKEKYALEYDDYTGKNKCTPLECAVPLCKKCFDDDVYTCEECLPGYTFNKLGFCYIKPEVTPTITFKDIFRFALNGLVGGNRIFRFSFILRGLTRNKITEKHSFIISTMFKSTNRLRSLEDDKSFKTSCEFFEEMENSDSQLKFVDYNCYFDSDKDLKDNYKMDSISEGNFEDKGNLKAYNLNDLVKNVDDITKDNSVFGRNELNKYILFIIDENSKEIKGENIENFNFTISGITNKPMSNKLLGKLTFLNSNDKKASCEIDAKDKNNAFMKCDVDAKEIDFTNKQISIKEQELEGQDNNIYFDGLNDVLFIGIEPGDENQKKSKKKIGLIIGLVIGLVVCLSIAIFVSLYFYKKKHTQNTKDNIVDVNICNNKNTSENIANPQTTETLQLGKKKKTRKKKKKKSDIIK